MELFKAPEVPVKPSPEIVRKVFANLEALITRNRERFGANHPFEKDEQASLKNFAQGRYFMYPFEKGVVHWSLSGVVVSAEANDHEYEVLTPSVSSLSQ